MKYLTYRITQNNCNELFIEDLPIRQIAKEVGTPFYCYSQQNLIENYKTFEEQLKNNNFNDFKICYAIKANFNLHLVSLLSDLGSGIDAVSAGEIFVALKAGISPHKIVFAGVGKTQEEMIFALENGVEEFSVESLPEMYLLNEVATKLNKKAKFSLRVNPNVDAKTHQKISTGKKGDKFGVDIEQAISIYETASKLSGLEVYGIAMHIGSQITSLEPFKKAFAKMRQLFEQLQQKNIVIHSLDFGGGIGITYRDESSIEIASYCKLLKDVTKDLNVKIVIAPGRAIVGNAGVLVTKTLFIKPTAVKNYLIVDSAINDLMRPGLYGSYHEVMPVIKSNQIMDRFDVAGPVCESTDVLAHDRLLNTPKINDLLVFCSAGAYGSSMASEYNFRKLVPEVLVNKGQFKIIRRRPSYDEMLRLY
ncbi:diaminopimelate decarboxylase [Alphaproteobacteria bacterium]|nr:diaminopimelate decarboxylase [Alphaproteobacteria bacterium]